MPLKNDRYTYQITWSENGGEYIGKCLEFPSLSWFADAPESALSGIRMTVTDVIADMKTNGEKIPEPIALRNIRG